MANPYKANDAMVNLGKSIWLLAILAFVTSSCALRPELNAKDAQGSYFPTTVPDGWVADFSYAGSLSDYLRLQVETATAQGEEPFVFFFAEWCGPCVRIRERATDADVARLLEGKRIIMLNFEYMNSDGVLSKGYMPGKLQAVPAIAQLGPGGVFSGAIVYGTSWQDAIQGDDERVLRNFFNRVSPRAEGREL